MTRAVWWALLLCTLTASPAMARPGLPLGPSVATARAAKVPLAVFMVRNRVVVAEEWHSYTEPTQDEGPSWPIAKAQALRSKLMGGARPEQDVERHVAWASFPVWCYGYSSDRWVIFESKRHTDRVWAILAVLNWYWSDAISTSFEPPADSRGYKLINGKLIELTNLSAAPPKPQPHKRPEPSPGFPSGFATPGHRR